MSESLPDNETAEPNPEFLIKSIAEQGYSLETALADLMDNSISAGADKIEVVIRTDQQPFTLFLADNGKGMDAEELRRSMQFPSSSPEKKRPTSDLGRFGLGMKTASFSQTRRFTVISRKKGTAVYCGKTWDVAFLRTAGWRLIINSEEEIAELLSVYGSLSRQHLNAFDQFVPNTLIVWHGLFKFENYLEYGDGIRALKKEIADVTSDYLSLVFHRFMERANALRIRINNHQLIPFNPFPTAEKDFRPLEYRQRSFRGDIVKLEGFILPSRSIDESRESQSIWTTRNRGLMDMEGIYVYRAGRIILFGGWNGLIRKAPRLQLARLRVEVGTNVDHLLHLNVAKSQIVIPHDLKRAFENYVTELKSEAEREFFNRGVRNFSGTAKKDKVQLFHRTASTKGVLLELNEDFMLIRNLVSGLNSEQRVRFRLLMRMINTSINSVRQSHQDVSFESVRAEKVEVTAALRLLIEELLVSGITPEQIRKDIIPALGFTFNSLPPEILQLLNAFK